MDPFRKIKETAARFRRSGKVRRWTVDLQHYTVVDHTCYAEPSAFTSTPQYRPYTEEDFQEVVERGTRLLDELDLAGDGMDALDMQPMFRSLYLKAELAESRALHKWSALHTRSDVLSELRRRHVELQKLQKHLERLTQERDALDAKG